jgi:hypothetical protein
MRIHITRGTADRTNDGDDDKRGDICVSEKKEDENSLCFNAVERFCTEVRCTTENSRI